jgi:uncharacterized membrane protein
MSAPGPGTATGLAPNVAGALSYLIPPITGILFLVLEKGNPFVRFHAMQSTVIGIAWIVLWAAVSVLALIPVLGWIAGFLLTIALGIGGFILWLLLLWKAFQGQEWEVPWAGPLARKQLGQSI